MNGYAIGIDIGSTCAKAVVLSPSGEILRRLILPTGWSSVDTARQIEAQLSEFLPQSRVAATGYGRVCVPYANRQVTEITCHARGACALYREKTLNVIDIGGQDTKIIRVEDGRVADFLMNDKCSAGTGRFLDVMAGTLGLSPQELNTLASRGGGVHISSMCTVFAESEIISLIGRGEKKENIAYAVVDSIATKVAAQASRLLPESGTVCLTGGLCEEKILVDALFSALNRPILTCPDGRYAGAIGAATLAGGFSNALS